MMRKAELETKVGLFVSLGVGLLMVAILVLGSTENLLSKQSHFVVRFTNVEGMIPGAKVVLGGVNVGTVQLIDLDGEKQNIIVKIGIAAKYATWVRKDTTAEISTQGVLGDKYIILSTGDRTQAQLADGEEIPPHSSAGLSEFINKGDQLMVSLNSIAGNMNRLLNSFEAGNKSEIFFQGMANSAKNLASATDKLNKELDKLELKAATQNLNSILGKVNNGTGTLGALVNDPGLYDDVKALFGGANRNRIVRNLVRQTVKKNEEAVEEDKK
jgi:phospholipid/cholesterol/gamma-HCH transport system substrate-binding protein